MEEPIAAVAGNHLEAARILHAVVEEGIDLEAVRQSVVAAVAHRNLLVEGEDSHHTEGDPAEDDLGRNLDLEEGILLRTEADLEEDRMTFAVLRHKGRMFRSILEYSALHERARLYRQNGRRMPTT